MPTENKTDALGLVNEATWDVQPNEADYYRTVTDADAYFREQLFADDWTNAEVGDKAKALLAATRAIDRLRFAGVKRSVYQALVAAGGESGLPGKVLLASTSLTDAEIQTADDAQALQFPRDTQAADTVPDDVFWAVCEEAICLLSGRRPDIEQDNLQLTSDGAGSYRVSYNRQGKAPLHTLHQLTSAKGWQYLQRWLDPEANSFLVKRI